MDDKALVEPSNDEQSQWPEATEAYVRGLEEQNEAQATRIEALEAALREAARLGTIEGVKMAAKWHDDMMEKSDLAHEAFHQIDAIALLESILLPDSIGHDAETLAQNYGVEQAIEALTNMPSAESELQAEIADLQSQLESWQHAAQYPRD